MTLEKFIIQLRRRSQDLRQVNNQLITSALSDGIVWSANDLLDVANLTMQEVSRLLVIYEASPIAKQLTENNLVIHDEVTFAKNVSIADIANSVIGVIGLSEVGERVPEYLWVSPARFEAYKNSEDFAIKGKRYYTVLRDADSMEKAIHIMPTPTADAGITLRATLLYQPEAYELTDFDLDLYFSGIDDFLLDVGERNLRLQLKDTEGAALLQQMIELKLGIKREKIQ